MSAIGSEANSKAHSKERIFSFAQDIPIPSYLIAIAVGALESRDIGPRSKVWSEKEFIEAAAYEFANTEHQLKTAEEICGPYLWGRYDLLVLPPSFPFGGMENPCLTFVTPTLLAGDRSLANVVAHEIAHSWTGNLVTNANFEHFWLNEGFTVLIERKIVGRLENAQLQDFEAYDGLQELKDTIKRMGSENPLTKLVVDLKGIHPDDAFSTVPYEKGQLFLRYLEKTVGGPGKLLTSLW
ncbi:Peptidase [Oryctes borbonicus]|uniref:Peptidase n=1 Tax=Oryctes borbonicus TaxID=1629725 RepID=A0A0T6AVB0_9SCAR|nr:Peptidase [Oryctes borbonicus]